MNQSLYQKVIHFDKYARFKQEENRREYWPESIQRLTDYFESKMSERIKIYPEKFENLFDDIYSSIDNMKVMSSMRLFFSAGKAVEKENQMAYNCKFQSIHSLKSFADLLYSLMCTCGVGCSVQNQYIDQLPHIPKYLKYSNDMIVVEDSREGWAQALLEFLNAIFNVDENGTGTIHFFDISKIRKKGEILRSSGGTASGAVPLLVLRHFIDILVNNHKGEKLTSTQAFDIVCKIAGCVVAGGLRRSAIITLFDEDDDEMFHIKDPEKLRQNPHRYNSNNTVVATKKETIIKVLKIARYNGEPGLLLKNNVDRKMKALGRVLKRGDWGINPCVTGDTMILTDNGYTPIINTIDKKTNIWNGSEWSEVEPFSTGLNDLLELEFSNGSKIRCTPYHKWVLKNKERKEAKDLKIGDKLEKCDMPIIDSDNKSIIDYYSQGFYSGDGNKNLPYSWLYEPKFCCQERLIGDFHINPNMPKRITWKHGDMLSKDFVPVNNSTVNKLDWLAGILDSDGNTTDNKNSKQLTITSIDKDFLIRIMYMLNTIGCNSKVCDGDNSGLQDMPDGKGGISSYYCQQNYRLLINSFDTKNLVDNGLICERLIIDKTKPNRNASRFVYVKSIKKLDKQEETFCLNEPKNNTFIANGVITGNCGEIILRPNSLCNLTEVILRPDDTLEDDLEKVRLAAIIGMMQATLTDFKFIDDEVRQNQEEEALLGVSLTGILDCPQYNNLPEEILKTLKEKVEETVDEFWHVIGLKNRPISTTTIKPSGTVSLLVNSSSGIHARYAKHYIKRTIIGEESELYNFLTDNGVKYTEVDGVNGKIFEFPIKAPEKSLVVADITLDQQIDNVERATKHWCSHNTSSTIYVKNEEWNTFAERLINSKDILSLSFLPLELDVDTSGFAYLPLEAISEEDFLMRKETEDKIVWEDIKNYTLKAVSESDDEQKMEFSCVGGACELQ